VNNVKLLENYVTIFLFPVLNLVFLNTSEYERKAQQKVKPQGNP